MTWWLSSKKMTVLVETKNGVIIDSAPIIQRFKGQKIENLENWMRKQGGFCKRRLKCLGKIA